MKTNGRVKRGYLRGIRCMYWGRILGRNRDKSLKSFPPWYSQSPLLTDFTLLLNKICLKVVYKEDGALWNLITFKVRKLPEAKISWFYHFYHYYTLKFSECFPRRYYLWLCFILVIVSYISSFSEAFKFEGFFLTLKFCT
jgi:hypothetical protein